MVFYKYPVGKHFHGQQLPALVLWCVLIIYALAKVTTRYIVTDGYIIAKMLFLTMRKIEISRIQTITRTYNMMNAPAASYKRLYLDMGMSLESTMMTNSAYIVQISPAREKEFIELLRLHNFSGRVNIDESVAKFPFSQFDI